MERHLHASQPKAVARPKYRETELDLPSNIMFDKRVKRGATQGRPTLTTAELKSTPTQGADGLTRTMNGDLLATTNQQLRDLLKPQPGSLQHILSHTHVVKKRVEVPMHLYLEEQTKPPEQTECDTQTDAFLEQAARPKYIQPKRGVDVRIQVDTDMVFNFDRDVRPLLDVLCGKTLEQALVEVNEEMQIRALIDIQDSHAELQRAEARRIKLMEFDELQMVRQKRAADTAQKELAVREAALKRKVAALAVARHQLHDVPAQSLDFLYAVKAFRTPLEKEIEEVFLPWLCQRTNEAAAQIEVSFQLADAEIRHSLERFIHVQRAVAECMPYRLFIHWAATAPPAPAAENPEAISSEASAEATEEGEPVAPPPAPPAPVQTEPIGPIEVPHDATITDIRDQVIAYLLDPFLRRPDLSELLDVAIYARHGLDALQSSRAARGLPPVEEPEAPAVVEGQTEGHVAPTVAPHQRRIKFVAAGADVEGEATLLQLANDGRLQQIEMRVDAS